MGLFDVFRRKPALTADGLTPEQAAWRASVEAELLKAIGPAQAEIASLKGRLVDQDALTRQMLQRKGAAKDPVRITAEIIDPKSSTMLQGFYSLAGKRLIREMAKTHPLIIAASAKRSEQLAQFARYYEGDDAPGWRIAHKDADIKDADASRVTKSKEWKSAVKRVREIIEHPMDDERLGSSFGHVLDQAYRNWLAWDLIPIKWAVPASAAKNRPADAKDAVGFVMLDGGTIDPLSETLASMVEKESGNESFRRMTWDYVMEAGRAAILREYPGVKPEDLDEHGWIQRDLSGNPVRIFRRDELLVSIRCPQTDPEWRGRGISPIYQALFALQSWLDQLYTRISKGKPGLNHLTQLLAVTGAASTQDIVRDLWKVLMELVEGYGTQLPLVPVPPGCDLKSIPLDPQGKMSEQLGKLAEEWVAIICAILGIDPRDINMPSLARTAEKGGLGAESAEYSQLMSRQEGLTAALMHLESTFTAVVQAIGHPDMIFEFSGIRQYDSEKSRLEKRKAGDFWSMSEDRIAFGEEEEPEGFEPVTIGGKTYDVYKFPKGQMASIHMQLITQQIMADQQAQAMEQQASQGAWDAAQGAGEPGGMPGQEPGAGPDAGGEAPPMPPEEVQPQLQPQPMAKALEPPVRRIRLEVRAAR